MDDNTIWLVTQSERYYPRSGARDWMGMHATRALAEQQLAELRTTLNDYAFCSWTIVEINITNLTWREHF